MSSTQNNQTQFSPASTAYRINDQGSATLLFAPGVGLNKDIWQPLIDCWFNQIASTKDSDIK